MARRSIDGLGHTRRRTVAPAISFLVFLITFAVRKIFPLLAYPIHMAISVPSALIGRFSSIGHIAVSVQIERGVQFASGARDGDAALEKGLT
jgi:hypothetical protein